MSSPLISVVFICWNRKEEVCETLRRIQAVDYDNLEIIVVDNCSTDGTPDKIESDFTGVKLIRLYKNFGIAAYNIGFKNAKGEYIVILDDDSFPATDALRNMVDKFEADPKLALVAFDVRNYYNYDEIKVHSKDAGKKENKAAEARDYLLAFNGAGAGVRKCVFEKIGYYPEEFFLYWNEQDTAFRILASGYSIRFFPEVVSYHKYSPKNRTSLRAPFFYTRNAFWLIWKNYPLNMAVLLTLKLMQGCINHSLEQRTLIYLKAMASALLHIFRLKGKRKPVSREIAMNLRIPYDVVFTFYR